MNKITLGVVGGMFMGLLWGVDHWVSAMICVVCGVFFIHAALIKE